MFCPNCKRKQYFSCGIKTCRCHKEIPKGELLQIKLENDILKCPYCGFVEHIDFWEELEIKQMENKNG